MANDFLELQRGRINLSDVRCLRRSDPSLPVVVCHSQISPLFSPAIIRVRAAASLPRGEKFVVMKPPSGRPMTEFKPMGSGATAHPIHVNVGGLERASNSKTSIDSLSP